MRILSSSDDKPIRGSKEFNEKIKQKEWLPEPLIEEIPLSHDAEPDVNAINPLMKNFEDFLNDFVANSYPWKTKLGR